MSALLSDVKAVLAVFPIVVTAILSGCAAGDPTGGGTSGNWYYHWSCNGDSECLSLNPTGQPSGTINEGPAYAACSPLLTFASKFWNIPPATNSCDHSSTTPIPPPPVPVIGTFVPTSGVQGTTVTLTGSGFPTQIADITVSFGAGAGAVNAVVTSVTSTQVVFTVPALTPGNYPITIMTAGGSATSTSSFAFRTPILVVTTSGTGSVVSSPTGINCSSGTGTCTASFPFGSVIGLTETSGASASFNGWTGGGCSGTGTACSVTLTSDVTVTAAFLSRTLTVVVTGSGNVTSTPAGINCGGGNATCSAPFIPGSLVTLTETPGAAASFGGWSGGTCSPASTTCALTLNSDVTITAPFLTYTLTILPVAVNGTAGTGTITSVPAGINCVGVVPGSMGCAASFAGGTQVTLTNTPAGGSSFAGWTGAGCSGSGPCIVTLNANTTITGQYCTPHGTVTYTTPGTYTHVACAAAPSVQIWGAGGGGGGAVGQFGDGQGSGGGGGGYGSATVSVTMGDAYVISVGVGGTAGVGFHASPYGELATAGGDGQVSSFGALVSATGGGGGTLGPATGGTGGTSAATTAISGSPGQVGGVTQGTSGGAGGAGGNGGAGGIGGVGVVYDNPLPVGSSPNAAPGTPPGGGGGGGGWYNFYRYDGGAGGNGQVIVSW